MEIVNLVKPPEQPPQPPPQAGAPQGARPPGGVNGAPP
jgi:hypothetical protein